MPIYLTVFFSLWSQLQGRSVCSCTTKGCGCMVWFQGHVKAKEEGIGNVILNISLCITPFQSLNRVHCCSEILGRCLKTCLCPMCDCLLFPATDWYCNYFLVQLRNEKNLYLILHGRQSSKRNACAVKERTSNKTYHFWVHVVCCIAVYFGWSLCNRSVEYRSMLKILFKTTECWIMYKCTQ